MSGTVSTRWYFSDWMSDPGIRASSLGARGLWKDLLCIAAANKGSDHGFVLLAGRVPSAADIARLVSASVEEVTTLLAELGRNGVFSMDRRKAIYCRRMVRAEKSRRNGREGGNPNLLNTKGKPNPVEPQPKPLIPVPVPAPPKSKNPEAGLFDPADLPPTPSEWPSDFREQFWTAYPRRTEKKSAIAKLEAIKRGGTVGWDTFMAGVLRYARHMAGTEERYLKHPTTWLNRGCWDDELSARPEPTRPPDRPRNGGNAFARMAHDATMEELDGRRSHHG